MSEKTDTQRLQESISDLKFQLDGIYHLVKTHIDDEMGAEKQISGISKLLHDHIGSEQDLLAFYNGLNWFGKTGFKIMTTMAVIATLIWTTIQIMAKLK
jgi:hypothetical protein